MKLSQLFRPAEARRWEAGLRADLRRRHRLRLHGLLIGSFMLALMWGTSHLQRSFGVDSLALRYAVSLGVGYLAYLGVLWLWARRLVAQAERGMGLDASDVVGGALDLARGTNTACAPEFMAGAGGGLGDAAGGVLEAAASAEEGAVVALPLAVVFLLASVALLGAGALLGLYFGWEVLLTVAVEMAFSFASARAAVRLEREGWLGAALRLTWKPLLAALCLAVALGALVDHYLPEAHSLPEALQLLRHH